MPSSVQSESASLVSTSRRELTSLVSGCGVYRPNRTVCSIAGRDRTRWLNGMVTNNVRDLEAGHGVYSFVLNPQGNILGDLYVFNRGDNLVAEIDREQAAGLLQILRRYIIMDQVEIEDLGEKMAVIGVAGPDSVKKLEAIGLPGRVESLQFSELSRNGVSVTVLRGDNPCFPNYEIWVSRDQSVVLWDGLLGAGAEPVSAGTLETFRILCGIPKFGEDIRDRTLPQETGQERALNFSKGCYIGQEIVERIRARGNVHRTFVGFEIEGPAPAAGTKVQSGGKDIGEITSVMSSPLKHKHLALGYLRKEAMVAGQVLSAGDAVVKARPLPFTDIFD